LASRLALSAPRFQTLLEQYLPFEQLGQIHLEYLLGSLETLEKIKCVGPSATDHKGPLALDDLMAEINVALRHSNLLV
jgi:hypothetical protein